MVQILQKLLHILNKDQKRKVAGLGVMIFIGALMEMIGVGLIMPVVEGVMAPDQLLNKWYIQILERFIHFDTPNQWLLFLIGVIIAVYFIKNGYLLLQTYVQSRFVNTNQSNTISYMLEEYLNRPYEFYLNADIPTIFRTIDGDVPKVFTTLMEYIQLATELMVSAVLCVTLLVTNPTMTIFIVVVMGGTTVVILKILKPTLNRLGRTSQRLQSQMGKWRLQSIYGIKDVKILNKEHYFASSFGKYSQENAKLTTEYAVLNNMPRLLLETLSICGILGYLAICILNSADMTELVPQISAFAVAAMRLMPSVNRINTHMSNIAFYEPSVNYVYENVDFTSYRLHGKYEKDYDPHTPPMELKKEIRMEDVSYTYPESDKVILDHAQMLVPVGKSVGVMGPSGAGKSTAIDILMGLLQVQGGEILCDGRNIFENYPSWLSHIGYIPQTIYLTDDSIRENIAFGVAKEDIKSGPLYLQACDGNPDTYIESSWFGIEFTPPVCAKALQLYPRNSRNGIEPNNHYQLLYFDNNKWIEHETVHSKYNYIDFDSIPSGTIYWLRNLDQGKEELPFFFPKDKQVFISQEAVNKCE